MAVRFDAADDRIYFQATLPNPATTGLTVLGWWRIRVDLDNFETFYRTETSASGTIHTCATYEAGTDVNVFTTAGELNSLYGAPVDEWFAVAVVDNGSGVTLYVRPEGGSTIVTSGSIGSATPAQICIGGRSNDDDNEYLDGNAAYVRVFADALTQAEVEAEWDSPTAVLTAWADWPLATATDLTDHSGNGRDMTPVGAGPTTETGPPVSAAPGPAPDTVFDLSNWHLTTPAEDPDDGDAEQIDQPELATYASDFFYLDEFNRMVCVAP
ncbi:MAG: LamG-like jellyroll fold domain-containing protein, partial [Stackebrandtia sp.]